MKAEEMFSSTFRRLLLTGAVLLIGALLVSITRMHGSDTVINSAAVTRVTHASDEARNVPLSTSCIRNAITSREGTGEAQPSADKPQAMVVEPRADGGPSDRMAAYKTILATLDLPSDRLQRLEALIAEWEESDSDADDLGKENRLGAEATHAVRTLAEASLERELGAVVGAANLPVVRAMIELTPQLTEIAHGVGGRLSSEGRPLSAEQMLSLAEIYHDAYAGPLNSPPVDRSRGFDPATGLGDADRRVLTSAAGVLDPDQLRTLGSIIGTSTATSKP